jgi:hypothetical protein
MDTETIKIIIYVLIGGAVLFALVKLAGRLGKCDVCGEEGAGNSYDNLAGKSMILCKNHLVENWKADVISTQNTMIVIEPDFNTYPNGYMYANTKQLRAWEYPKSAEDNINSILDKIAGKNCAGCGKSATVAFFKKEDYNFPNMEDIKAEPKYLCKSCAVDKVAPLILSAPKPFVEGFMPPTPDRGVYHIQEF